MPHAHLLFGSRPSSSPSCPSCIFSSSTYSLTPSQNPSALRKEDCGSMSLSPPPTSYEEDFDTNASVYHSSDPDVIYRTDDDRDELVSTEIEDEQIKVALASRLSLQESDAEGDMGQVFHSNVLNRFQQVRSTRSRPDREAEESPTSVASEHSSFCSTVLPAISFTREDLFNRFLPSFLFRLIFFILSISWGLHFFIFFHQLCMARECLFCSTPCCSDICPSSVFVVVFRQSEDNGEKKYWAWIHIKELWSQMMMMTAHYGRSADPRPNE